MSSGQLAAVLTGRAELLKELLTQATEDLDVTLAGRTGEIGTVLAGRVNEIGGALANRLAEVQTALDQRSHNLEFDAALLPHRGAYTARLEGQRYRRVAGQSQQWRSPSNSASGSRN